MSIQYKWLSERGIDISKDPHQAHYIKQLWDDSIQAVFCLGKSGTGKTTIAALAGAYMVHNQTKSKLIYIRSTQTVGRELGFLEGSLERKQAPYMAPIEQAINLVKPNTYEDWIRKEILVTTTPTYLRGVNFDDAFVLLDEAQSYDLIEMQTILTRVKSNCKCAIVGSLRQNDNPKNKIKGKTPFEWYMEHFKDEKRVAQCELLINHRSWFADMADDIGETIGA